MSSIRMLQVAKLIREHVASLLASGHVRDPRLQDVVISHVTMTPDLQTARIYYSFYNFESSPTGLPPEHTLEAKEVQKGLNSEKGFFRRCLGQKLFLKHTPDMVFFFDESVQRGARVSAVINSLHSQDKDFSTQAHDGC